MMDLEHNVFFKCAISIVANVVFSLFIEKGISILQDRKFNRRYALGYFLLLIAFEGILEKIIRSCAE
jgi:hypothetical protein